VPVIDVRRVSSDPLQSSLPALAPMPYMSTVARLLRFA
jgi:hypothetical protein